MGVKPGPALAGGFFHHWATTGGELINQDSEYYHLRVEHPEYSYAKKLSDTIAVTPTE